VFDIGFSEILVILVVALIVIGPERLPKVARNMGQWWGRTQRYIGKVKQEVNRSIELEELREMERKLKEEASALERSVQQAASDIERDTQHLQQELEQTARALPRPVADDHFPPQKP